MTERWDRVTAVFAAARALDPPLRARFLDLACESDHDMRTDVDALLAADVDDAFLIRPPWTLISDAIGARLGAGSPGDHAPPTAALSAGTRLGPYEIRAAIGAGGMGEVYRAHDTTLHRDVALKLLPDAFVRDPDRLGRFQREAQLLASLNHPNVAHLYGFEQSDARPFLVLELVDGQSLADYIERGPVPFREAIAIARQVADALGAAHAQGVVHRDLKPANIRLREDGAVKLLDFGLAKAFDRAWVASGDPARPPAPSAGATEAGLILGTVAYMAPEQARGRPADPRADVWAFGVVLFEMLAGRRPFSGETASEEMASVMRDDPDWTRLPADLPDPMRRLLRRCLKKDPRHRLSSIADARLDLAECLEAAPAAAPGRRVAPLARLAGAGLAGATLTAVAWLLLAPTPRPPSVGPPTRVSVLAPAGLALLQDPSESALSPDGRLLVFTAADADADARLWIRPLDAAEAHPLAGTKGATLPFWSPDSRQVAFFAGEQLRKVPAAGGTVEILCAAKDARGGSWGSGGVIVFAPAVAGPLQAVPASGGKPHAVTTLDAAHGETGHRFPWFLPDGRHFLYVALPPHDRKCDLLVGALDGTTRAAVTSADGAAAYAAPGFLLFPRQNALVAQRFDPVRMKLVDDVTVIGEAPATLAALYSGSRAASASASGALAYLDDRLATTRLEWLDRSGHAQGVLPVPDGRYLEIALAPDGRRASVVRYASVLESDIWIIDLRRGAATRLTYGPGVNSRAAWSPDGKRIVFASDRRGPRDLFTRAAGGAAPEEPLFTSPALFKEPRSWSPDGRWVVFDQIDPQTNRDLWIIPVDGDRSPRAYLRTPFTEGWGQVSPDGRWMAYASDESGRTEVYVDSFPTPRNKFRVTDHGGASAMWRKDGRELAVMGLDGRSVLVADVTPDREFRAGTPHPLLALPERAACAALTPDFQRVLVARPTEEDRTSSFTLIFNWSGALEPRR
jgi:Tol biopolymer transport system component